MRPHLKSFDSSDFGSSRLARALRHTLAESGAESQSSTRWWRMSMHSSKAKAVGTSTCPSGQTGGTRMSSPTCARVLDVKKCRATSHACFLVAKSSFGPRSGLIAARAAVP